MRTRAKRVGKLEPGKPEHVRVAIYTRKSVTDGLEQSFNSLHAQRESVEAYVRSMRCEGWQALEERYDDGGYSGGSMDRPAFQRLMADVAAGKVDVVAVYRQDRVSRSLLDFITMLHELGRRRIEFVSVTERFDSSTPSGRFVLHQLASVAQYERESIALRTKDKVSASRRRGMWTGGRPVLGYDVVDKKLVVNPSEAEHVRNIFQLYLDLGGVLAVVAELRLRGITNKRWTTKAGASQGGSLFDRNVLTGLLKNPLYVGMVRAGDEIVEGEHDAIIARDVWEAAQRQFAAQAPRLAARGSKRSNALLAGIARCKCGAALSRTTSKRPGRTYTYYACSRSTKHGQAACPGSRVTVGELDAFVVQQVREIGRDPSVIEAAVAADRDQRGVERRRLEVELSALKAARGRHAGERERVIAAVGAGAAPQGLVARVGQLDGLVAEADARIAALSQDLAALAAPSDVEGLRAALLEFEGVWDELDKTERARALALVLDEVVVDAKSGEAELRLRVSAP
jgi:site-specific DNA recombinase